MNVIPYRRAYFALCKKLGLDDDARHAFNEAQTGKASTTAFTVDDWRQVVAELQARAGQKVEPSRPRIRARDDDQDGIISASQLEFITRLATKVTWRLGVTDWIRSRLLTPLRRANWDGRLETLFAAEARNVIAALRNWTDRERRKGAEPRMNADERGSRAKRKAGCPSPLAACHP